MSEIDRLLLRRMIAGSTKVSLAREMGVSSVGKRIDREMGRIKKAISGIPFNPHKPAPDWVNECLRDVELCYELGSPDVTVNLAGPPLYTISCHYLG